MNTCGFIDDAVKESLDTIGEALAVNGKVIVTGCLGAKSIAGSAYATGAAADIASKNDDDNLIKSIHPSVLAVTGPHATQEVMEAVHTYLPKPHNPFMDLMPDRQHSAIPGVGIKLTPRHYAYLKISEGCNHRCTFCIIQIGRASCRERV